MEKIKLQLNKRENIKRSFAGQEIEIIPYIELDLLSSLVEVVFSSTIASKMEDNEDTIVALDIEDKLVCLKRFNLAIVDQCTNIDVDDIDTDILLSSGIDDYVVKFISNYNIGKEMILSEIEEYNLNATIFTMFNDLPSVDEMGNEISKIGNVLENISEPVLKNVMLNYTSDEVQKQTKQEIKNKKLKN